MNSALIILVDVIELDQERSHNGRSYGWLNFEDCIRDIRILCIQNHLSEQ